MSSLTNIKKEMKNISKEIKVGTAFGETLAAMKATPLEKLSELIDNALAAAELQGKKRTDLKLTVYQISENSYYIVIEDKSGGFNEEIFSNRISKFGNDVILGKEDSLNRYNIGMFNALFGLGECKIILSKTAKDNTICSDGISGNIFGCYELSDEKSITVEIEGKTFKHSVIKEGTVIGIYCNDKDNSGSLFKTAKMETSFKHMINDFKVRYKSKLEQKKVEAIFKLIKLDGTETKTVVKESFKTIFEGKIFSMTLEEEGVKAHIKMALLASDKKLEETFGKDYPQLSYSKTYSPFKVGLNQKNAMISQNGKMLLLVNSANLFKNKNGEEKAIHPDYNNIWIEIDVEGVISYNTKNGVDTSHKSWKTLLKLIQDFIKKSGFNAVLKKQSKEIKKEKEAHNQLVSELYEKEVKNKPSLKKECKITTGLSATVDILEDGIIYELKTVNKLDLGQLLRYVFAYDEGFSSQSFKRDIQNYGKLNEVIYITPNELKLTDSEGDDLKAYEKRYGFKTIFKTFEELELQETFSKMKIIKGE